MWQILHASFWKFCKLSSSGISLNWSIIDEVTTRKKTAYFFGPLCIAVLPAEFHNPRVFYFLPGEVKGASSGHVQHMRDVERR